MSKMILGRIKFKSTFTKLVLSYVIIIILITTILSIALFRLFLDNSLKVIEADARGRLSQNINALTLMKNRVYSLGSILIKDSSVVQALYGEKDLPPTDKADLSRKMYNIIESDSIIHSIFLYNPNNQGTIDTFGVENKEAMTVKMLDLLRNFSARARWQFFPNVISYKKVNGEIASENIISVIISDSGYYKDLPDSGDSRFPLVGAVIINLNANVIQGSIAPAIEDQKLETMIVDASGEVVFDSLMRNFGENIGSRKHIQKVLNNNKNEDTFTAAIDGEKSLVVYKKIDDAYEWTYINIYSYKILFSDINRLGKIILIICMIILVVSVGLSIATAKTIYNPFKNLINRLREGQDAHGHKGGSKIEMQGDIQYLSQTYNTMLDKSIELESSVNDSIKVMKRALLSKVAQDSHAFEPKLNKRFYELFAEFIAGDDLQRFAVVLFSLDTHDQPEVEGETRSNETLLSALEKQMKDSLSAYFLCEPIDDYESSCFCFVIKINNNSSIEASVSANVGSIHNDLKRSINRKVSCAIGIPVEDIESIQLSYNNAQGLIKYRLVYGFDALLSYDMEELHNRKALIMIDREKERLIQAMKAGDITGVESEIESLINNISQCQYDYIMLTLNQLILHIVSSVKTFYTENINELDFNNIYRNMNKVGTLDEMRVFFIQLCGAVVERIKIRNLNRRSEMINNILNYIDEHYQQYDITTESLAIMANLTPGYFGKLFAGDVGKTANEYILDLRLSKAQSLLKTSKLTINDISAKVGFNNPTYFTTIFKRNFGMTPNQFRTDNKNIELLEQQF